MKKVVLNKKSYALSQATVLQVKAFCEKYGIKKGEFVDAAIRERLNWMRPAMEKAESERLKCVGLSHGESEFVKTKNVVKDFVESHK